MRDHLVHLAPEGLSENYVPMRIAFGDSHFHSHPVAYNEPNPNAGDFQKKTQAWECEEREVPSLVDYLTKNFPGRDVHVSKLVSVHSRIIGDVVNKTVTKNGVLPA